MIINAVLMTLVAYLLGSISSAVLICRLWRLPDPRKHGSNNPGATNVYRIGGGAPAALTMIFDVLKGTLPVWSAYFLKVEPLYLGMVAVAACLGHIYPVFFNFKGGKGVATAFGALLPIGAGLVGLMVATWLLVVWLSGYSSLAAIVAAVMAPIYTYFLKPTYTLPVLMLSLLILIRHKDNICRLIKGTESKVRKNK
ncbi:MAG: glycerol-3-phosphate acyltransferase PlsY [Alteromonadaceae bacterium]|jgi:glycerol-3-phosphate acyltransferase PlsY